MSTTKTMITNSPKLQNRMAQDKREIEKYLKVFCSKAAQVIVQSRLGEKCQTFSNPRSLSNDWFNLSIDDEPDILAETKKVIDTKQGESVLQRLPLCVEISLRTVDGDKMILEVWSLSCNKQLVDKQARVTHSIYNRMGTLLKSLILVTRSTPTYKLSRKQSTESYKIFYHIFTGFPSIHNLGEGFKEHIIGDLNTNTGQLRMAVAYRTKMTISPTQTGRDTALMLKSDHFNDISPKNARYHIKKTEKKVIDLDKPLLTGAFVDLTKITQFTEQDYILPEMPTFKWLTKTTKMETISSHMLDNEKKNNSNKDLSGSPDSNKQKNWINNSKNNSTNNNSNTIVNSVNINNNNNNNINISNSDNSNSNSNSNSDNNNNSDCNSINNENNINNNNNNQNLQAKIEITKVRTDSVISDCSLGKEDRVRFGSTKMLPPEDDRILKEMNFPFATATPMKDLAKFYRDCFNAPPLHVFNAESPPSSLNGDAVNNAAAEEIFETDVDNEVDSLTRQLEKFETSLGDFDSLVTSLCCHSNSNS